MSFDKKRNVWIVCPPEDSFEDVKRNVVCPVENCDQVLPHNGCLRMHLTNTHGLRQKCGNGQITEKDGPVEYHCPRPSCVYNKDSPRHFASMKLLRQHYRKVHAEKKYKCSKCGTGFGLSTDCVRHEGTCGVIYKCGSCQCPYTTKEAMMTHCRRKSHKLPEEILQLRVDKTVKNGNKQTNKKLKEAENTLPASNSVPSGPSPKVILVNILPTPSSTGNIKGSQVVQHKRILPKPTPNFNIIPLTTAAVTPDIVKVRKENVATRQNSTMQTDQIQSNSLNKGDNSGLKGRIGNTIIDEQVGLKGQNRGQTETKSCDVQFPAIVMETGIQTNVTIPQRKQTNQCQNAVQTQTTGDFILQTAMVSANIPISKASVGTQMTPRSKVRVTKRRNVCSSETQTIGTQPTSRKRRRRKGSFQGTPPKMDFTCQTSARQIEYPSVLMSDSTCQVESLRMTSTFSQTNTMVDNICQTTPTPLQHVNPKDSFLNASPVAPAYQSASNGLTDNLQNKHLFMSPSLSNSVPSVRQIDQNTGCNSIERAKKPAHESSQMKSTRPIENFPVISIPISNNFEVNVASDTSVQKNSAISTTTASAEELTTCNPAILNQSNLSSQGTSTNFDLENDFQNFLFSSYRDISVATDVNVPLRNLDNLVSLADSQVQTLSSSSDLDVLLQTAGNQNNNNTSTDLSLTDTHTQTMDDFDVLDLLMNNMETQTTDELDLDTFTFTDIQTQTMLNFQAVEDRSTRNSDNPRFISLEDTQCSSTQTSTDHLSGIIDTFQQSEGTQTTQLDTASLTDTETQTPLPGMFSFSMTNTQTQTTLNSLEDIFAEFD